MADVPTFNGNCSAIAVKEITDDCLSPCQKQAARLHQLPAIGPITDKAARKPVCQSPEKSISLEKGAVVDEIPDNSLSTNR